VATTLRGLLARAKTWTIAMAGRTSWQERSESMGSKGGKGFESMGGKSNESSESMDGEGSQDKGHVQLMITKKK
jgi:hypothetical protein